MITKSFVTARYAETDQMGVIHHSVYAVWYELARTDFIKKVGNFIQQDGRNGHFTTSV